MRSRLTSAALRLPAMGQRPGGLPRLYSFRHYVGLERCEERLRSLLADFRWTTMADLLEQSGCVAQSRGAGV